MVHILVTQISHIWASHCHHRSECESLYVEKSKTIYRFFTCCNISLLARSPTSTSRWGHHRRCHPILPLFLHLEIQRLLSKIMTDLQPDTGSLPNNVKCESSEWSRHLLTHWTIRRWMDPISPLASSGNQLDSKYSKLLPMSLLKSPYLWSPLNH